MMVTIYIYIGDREKNQSPGIGYHLHHIFTEKGSTLHIIFTLAINIGEAGIRSSPNYANGAIAWSDCRCCGGTLGNRR